MSFLFKKKDKYFKFLKNFMETQKTQALAQQAVLKEAGSLQNSKSQKSTLLSYLLSTENFFKVIFFFYL